LQLASGSVLLCSASRPALSDGRGHPTQKGYWRGLVVLVIIVLLMIAIAGFWIVLFPQMT
jgi:hypothetical protein